MELRILKTFDFKKIEAIVKSRVRIRYTKHHKDGSIDLMLEFIDKNDEVLGYYDPIHLIEKDTITIHAETLVPIHGVKV